MYDLSQILNNPRANASRAYRQRQKEAGNPAKGGRKSGRGAATKHQSRFKRGQFIAIDGEGEAHGKVETATIGSDGKQYKSTAHHYTLLAASSGESLFKRGQRLSTMDCLDFLCDLGATYKKAIFVIFSGGYDVNHMLMYGFDREILQRISRGEIHEFQHNDAWYLIEYRARKSLTLKRGKGYVATKHGDWLVKWQDKITLWDVFGFFQENFVGVMGKWLGKDHRHYELIKDMKKRRGDFANVAQAKVNAYNQAELETLVELMKKVRDAIEGLGLDVRRWDGAGSVAASMFRKHGTKGYKNDDAMEEVKLAARTAYAGGRIEVCKVGFHDGPVFDYDVNSAYPSVMRGLPCLAHGTWRYGSGEPPSGFTLVHCRFKFRDGLPFYPLYYRTGRMQISFPSTGEGWYWYPEYEAAKECPGELEPLGYWAFYQGCDHQPFHWIKDYYETRKQWLKAPTEEWHGGAEKIIKLGLNSLYGKTAQQLGGTGDKAPAYHQLEWAGYITSATRARLYAAASKDPGSIIGFATDGIFSTRQLNVGLSSKKELGAWELKEPVPVGMTIAMAGVYWWHHGNNQFSHFSRGFDKESMVTPHLVFKAWVDGISQIDVPMHRLIGMGSACTSDDLWKLRGRFVEGFRTLRIDGKSHKRVACDVPKQKPHKHLVDLMPSVNVEYNYGLQQLSFPYPIKWLDGVVDEEHENDLEISRENTDTANI